MTLKRMLGAVVGAAAVGLMACAVFAAAPSTTRDGYEVNDLTRPQPGVVTPGTFSTQDQPGTAPSDAIVLFDGKDLSKWKAEAGDKDATWKVENGQLVCVPNTGG